MEETKSQEQVVEISPLSKGRRALAFLAEFFLTFILGISLFHLAVYPLGRLSVGYEEKAKTSLSAQKNRDYVLYGNKLLFYTAIDKQEVGDFTANLEYTFKAYLYQYVKQKEEINVRYDDVQGEIFATYYGTKLNEFYVSLGGADTYFNLGETITLKQLYVDEFMHAFIRGDELSAQGQADYDDFQTKVFLKGYNTMLDDIVKTDLTYEGISYAKEHAVVTSFIALEKNLVLASALIAYSLSAIILGLICPMFIKRRRTLAMLLMRNERLNAERLVLLKRKWTALYAVYYFAFNMAGVFFIPLGIFDFISLFSLPVLLPISLLSLALILGSGIFMLFEPFNRTLSDRLTGSVMVSEATLDDIYRAKGYHF